MTLDELNEEIELLQEVISGLVKQCNIEKEGLERLLNIRYWMSESPDGFHVAKNSVDSNYRVLLLYKKRVNVYAMDGSLLESFSGMDKLGTYRYIKSI